MNKEYKVFPISKEEFEYVGIPINRNENNNQIEITSSTIYVRTSPSINSKIVGFINPGIYDYIEVQKSDGYSWYFIALGWIAYSDDWAVIYEKKEKPIEEDDNSSKKGNIFVRIFKSIINFFKYLLKIN